MAQPELNSDKRYTYEDYLTWDDGERYELFDGVPHRMDFGERVPGEIRDMAPAPSRAHQDIVLDLGAQLRSELSKGTCRPFLAPFDVRLTAKNVVQPDLLVVSDDEKLDDKGCHGAPDFVIEVVSPTSVSRDLIKKTHLYEKHGIREYWAIDPVEQVVYVRRLQPPEPGQEPTFGPVELVEKSHWQEQPTLRVEALDGIALDVAAAFRYAAGSRSISPA